MIYLNLMKNRIPGKVPAFAAVIAISLLASCRQIKPEEPNYVIMVSMDGFRWDYTDKFPTPNFDRLAARGVKAESLIPCFPTKTFPNHYSIVTGLFPDHHGIVLNGFYDPESGRYFRLSDRETVRDGSFYTGEPIWITAEKQGLKTASYFWVGSEAACDGIYPSIRKEYDHDYPFEARIDSVVSWLSLPEDQIPRLTTLYFHEPDGEGHRLGPDHPGLGRTIIYLDSLLGDMMDKLERLPVYPRLNLILTSDHGMSAVSPDRYTDLADYFDSSWVDIIIGYNPNYVVRAAGEFYDSILSRLGKIPRVTGWPSEQVPERLVFGKNPRTLDFVLLADSAWSVGWNELPDKESYGAHGYDNANRDMHAIFYAAGPAFKSGYLQPSFSNTDIYSIIADILDIEPAETDGSLEDVRDMLRQP